MPVGKATKNGRKRNAPTNNNTIKNKNEIGEYPSTSKNARKLFPLPVPKRPSIKGSVLVCGLGVFGQLGLGSGALKYKRRRPALVGSIKDAVDVIAGGMHTLVLTNDGLVYSFGCNEEGALGRDSCEEGSEYEPGLINLPDKVVMVSAGDSHSACLLENGKVMAWGSFRDSHGYTGLTLDGDKRVPYEILPGKQCCRIASGADHLVILTIAGHIYTCGCSEQGQLGRVSNRSASGVGRRGKTEMMRPCKVVFRHCNLVDAIWATNYCTFVRESRTGRIFGFGLNNSKQLAYPKDISVVTYPVLSECKNVKNIAGGHHHTIILQDDGTVHAIGRYNYGRLGLGNINDDIVVLKCIDDLKDKRIVDVSCGEATSFAITDDGKLYSWGIGSNNQLGTGSDEDELKPKLIESKQTINKRILRVSSGGQHSVFLVQQTNNDNKTKQKGLNCKVQLKNIIISKQIFIPMLSGDL